MGTEAFPCFIAAKKVSDCFSLLRCLSYLAWESEISRRAPPFVSFQQKIGLYHPFWHNIDLGRIESSFHSA